jgi:hypothetical protein
VNGATVVRLVATYRGTPYLPVTQGTSVVGTLQWHLEGASDYWVFIQNFQGTIYTDVRTENGETVTCWSGDHPGMTPVVSGTKVTVTIPRSCVAGLTTLRAYALMEKVRSGSAAVYTDRAPNVGDTPRIAKAT